MIDMSDRTALAVCDSCGTREICLSRDTARSWLARHEAHAHPGTWTARQTLLMASKRAAETRMSTLR